MTTEEEKLSVLITNGTSGTARALTRQLTAAGHKVAAMTNTHTGAAQIRAEGGLPIYADPLRVGEIKGMIEMAQASAVVCLYPLVGLPYRLTADTQVLDQVDTLLQAAQGVDHLVYVSQTFLYGGGYQVDETAPLTAAGTLFIEALQQADKHVLNSGLPTSVLRAGYVYGPNSAGTIDLGETLKAGVKPISSTANLADWVHEDDLAQAIRLVVENQTPGETYNIVDDSDLTNAEFLERFAAEQGVEIAPSLMRFLGRSYSNRAAQALLKLHVSAANHKAKDQLGWSPKYPTIDSGLEHTLLVWRAEMPVRT